MKLAARMTFRVCFKMGTLMPSVARSTLRATCPTGIHVAPAAGHMSLRFRMEMMIQWAVPTGSIVDLWHKLFRKWDARAASESDRAHELELRARMSVLTSRKWQLVSDGRT